MPTHTLETSDSRAFGSLLSLDGADSPRLAWKISSKVAPYLDQGERVENLSWRLWHIRDLMLSDEAETSARGAMRSAARHASSRDQDRARMFSNFSAHVAGKLDSDKTRRIETLSAPDFRCMSARDVVRHRAVTRAQRREGKGEHGKEERRACKGAPTNANAAGQSASQSSISSIDTASTREATHAGRRRSKRRRFAEQEASSSESESSGSAEQQESQDVKPCGPDAQPHPHNKTPPICWRLAQQKAARLQQAQGRMALANGSPDGVPLQSSWTVEQIESAEADLREQGVELSAPLMAMLADLKSSDLMRAKSRRNDKDDVSEEVQAGIAREISVDIASDVVTASPTEGLKPRTTVELDAQHEKPGTIKQVVAEPIAGKDPATLVKAEQDLEQMPREAQCKNCGVTSTPLWRRDANFDIACNACGLYEKQHKAPRPVSLKQRRSDRRVPKGSSSGPNGEAGNSTPTSTSPGNATPNSGRDEWQGVHSGASCANCKTSTTPLWRKDGDNRVICNACGLYLKLHGTHRPVTMRMDAIKRRARYDDRRRMPTAGSETSMSFGIEDGETSGTPGGGQGTMPHIDFAPVQAYPAAFADINGLPFQPNAHHALNGGQPMQGVFPALPFANGQPQQAMPGNGSPFPNPSNGMHPPFNPINGVQIPDAFWQHQVCPMGASGKDCCQNLPPPGSDAQAALMVGNDPNAMQGMAGPPLQSATPQPPQTQETSMSADVEAILNTDWMMNFGCGTGLPDEAVMADMSLRTDALQPQDAGAQQHFDPSAIGAVPDTSIVGPSVPLKRRKASSGKSDQVSADADQRGQSMLPATPLAAHSDTAMPAYGITPDLSATVPDAAAGWWAFVPSPESIKSGT